MSKSPTTIAMVTEWFLRRALLNVHCSVCKEPLLCGQRIQWDHIHAEGLDGPHEVENLRPIHYDPCHKQKSAKDVKAIAKVKRLQNPKPSRHPMKSGKRKWPKRKFGS